MIPSSRDNEDVREHIRGEARAVELFGSSLKDVHGFAMVGYLAMVRVNLDTVSALEMPEKTTYNDPRLLEWLANCSGCKSEQPAAGGGPRLTHRLAQ
jgi:hypothetical protein